MAPGTTGTTTPLKFIPRQRAPNAATTPPPASSPYIDPPDRTIASTSFRRLVASIAWMFQAARRTAADIGCGGPALHRIDHGNAGANAMVFGIADEDTL